MSKGWSLGSSSTIDYYGYSLGGESFTISGLTSGLNTSTDSDGKYATPAGVTVSSKNVSLGAAALANQDVSISGDYKLYLGDAALSTASLGAGWSLSPADIFVYHTSGGYSTAGYTGAGFTDSNKAHDAGISWAASVGSTSTYTYYREFTTAGYSLGGDSLKIDYLAASLGGESFTISGLSSNLTASINSDGKYVTPAGVTVTNKNVSLGANALASLNVAISNSYSLYVADSLNPASLDAAWSVGSAENKTLVFNSACYSAAGYSGVGTSNLTYHVATRNELFSLSGFTGVPFSDASNVNQTAGEVSLTSDHLTQAKLRSPTITPPTT